MKKLVFCTFAASLISGCAGPLPEGATAVAEPDFPTGSNIARRNRAGGPKVDHMSREDFERARMEVKDPTPKDGAMGPVK